MAQDLQDKLEDTESVNPSETTSVKVIDAALSEEIEDDAVVAFEGVDFSRLTKEEILKELERELEEMKKHVGSASYYKHTNELVQELRPILDQFKKNEFEEAREKYIAENGNDEGFYFKGDEITNQIENFSRQIRNERSSYYANLEKNKEKNFTSKTSLLQRLRELVDQEESRETGASHIKTGWEDFKKIQDEWKSAGNINSPHNGTLWATYNALVDRYFSIRNIYFELKELDRKRNAELKSELCEKAEVLVESLKDKPMSREILEEANQLFEDYKHVGPAVRDTQEDLWQRFKKALDTLYDARRSQFGELKKSMSETFEIKAKIYEVSIPFTTFSSSSINDWNAKTKELLAIQDQWVAIKSPMLRDEGKELSKKFWAALKTFFHNKGEFFKQLEAKREQNLKAKTELCVAAEQILETGEDNAQNTQKIIDLQKNWKMLGQVPEKYKDSIFTRFKTACDAYFDRKRNKNNATEKEFEENLVKKTALCKRIEDAATSEEETSLDQLNAFKEEWSAIGFVPKKDMQSIQKRYIGVINAYVGAIGKLSTKEREQMVLESEVEVVRESESDRGLYRKEGDIRRKITNLENNISIWQNNIEFFAKSKTSDKLKAEFDRKIEQAENQLAELKHQLTVIIGAS